jgi:YHS domain-containing protein
MLRALLGLLLFLYIVRALMRLLHGIAEGMNPPRQTQPPAVALQRDPVCGTYVVPSRALSSGSGDATRFFCSERCREAWARR